MSMRVAPWIAVALLTLAGCNAAPSATADPHRRMDELADIARNGNESRVPAVIASLRSDDPLVRWSAQQTLLKITGTTNGYDWAAARPAREQAIETWVAWCRQKGLAMPAEAPAHG
jgi:hypothetical protein